MALQKIQLRPGIWREGTRYSNQGGWYDCDKIRFRSGLPEKLKGWVQNNTTSGSVVYRTVTLGAGSISTTNGSAVIVITDNGNGAVVGDSVTISGATAVGGISAANLNQTFTVSAISINTITVTAGAAASSTTTGGGTPTLVYSRVEFGLSNPFLGTCRALISWSNLEGQRYIGLGTSSKYYVLYGSYYDITPIVRTAPLAANSISTVSGSYNIFIRDSGNEASAGDYVNISGASDVGGITANTYINSGTTLATALLAPGSVIQAVLNQTVSPSGSPIATSYPTNTTTVTVTWPSNSLTDGNFVNITNVGAAVGGIPAANLMGTFQVRNVTANTFDITSAVAATSQTTGGAGATLNVADIMITVSGPVGGATSTAVGGGTPTLSYQLSTGLDTVSAGDGWGAGPYGWPTTTSPSGAIIDAIGWGEAYNIVTISQALRLWSHDNYGEDLIINPRGGGIYYETQANILAGERATNIVDIAGALSPPTIAQEVCVFGPASTVMAFACNPYADANQDPMTIRWSASQNVTDWQPRADNISGEIRLSAGSIFITKIETKQEIVVWTDTAMFSVRWVGFPDIFLADQIGNGTSIMGPNAKASVDDRVYWMGTTAFYSYSGRIEQVPCSVKDYVFSRINTSQAALVTCGTNLALGEVIWFYPAGTSTEVTSYVIYNYLENIWYYGELARTAWLDFGDGNTPIATGQDNVLYDHEVGYDDGSTNPASPIEAYIESSPFEIGDGDSMAFIRQIYPDLTFDNSTSTASAPSATFTITGYNYPGAAATSGPPTGFNPDTAPVNAVSTSELNQFTQQLSLRLRARSASMKLSSVGLGVAWRLGVPRFEMRTDGRR